MGRSTTLGVDQRSRSLTTGATAVTCSA